MKYKLSNFSIPQKYPLLENLNLLTEGIPKLKFNPLAFLLDDLVFSEVTSKWLLEQLMNTLF